MLGTIVGSRDGGGVQGALGNNLIGGAGGRARLRMQCENHLEKVWYIAELQRSGFAGLMRQRSVWL